MAAFGRPQPAVADRPAAGLLDTQPAADLDNALAAPNDSLILVESVMDPLDAPAAVIHSSNNGAELDYGPRGPQHRDNAQLRPAT